MNFFGSKTKAKLLAVSELNATARIDLTKKEEELARLKAEILASEDATRNIQTSIEAERQEAVTTTAASKAVSQELNAAQDEVAQLQKQIEAAKQAAAQAKEEKATLLQDLIHFEGFVKEEHESAQRSTEAAQRETASLRQEQEKERSKWQDTKKAHGELQEKAESSSKEVSQAQAELDVAKKELTGTREALQDLHKAHERLCEEQGLSEQSLEEQLQKTAKLEVELAELDKQHGAATVAWTELETAHRERQVALSAVSSELDKKVTGLQQELTSFERQFQEAKEQRGRLMGETTQVRDALGVFLPQYFSLQTEHAQSQRELENSRRHQETLQWEHHKVHRDLDMLVKSYDASGYASSPPSPSKTL